MNENSHLRRNLLNWTLRLIVGGSFVIAGALKIADPAKFALDISHYRLAPREMINLVAILLPWIEFAAGSFVLAGIWLRAAALLISSMTVLFLFAILSALARGLNIECGCFGTIGGRHAGLVNLAIDSTLLSLSALLAWRSRDFHLQEGGARKSATPLDPSPKASSTITRVSR
jgi:putative oxidoreductase